MSKLNQTLKLAERKLTCEIESAKQLVRTTSFFPLVDWSLNPGLGWCHAKNLLLRGEVSRDPETPLHSKCLACCTMAP